METRHFVEGQFGGEFLAICNYCRVMAAWGRKTWKFFSRFFLHFLKKTTPYGKIFKILFGKLSPPHWSMLLCSNVVKFFLREISEIMHYVPDQKIFSCLSNCPYSEDRTQNLPGPAPNNVLAVLQILSKSVHFWQSYSQMRECRFSHVEYFHDSPKAVLRFRRIITVQCTA